MKLDLEMIRRQRKTFPLPRPHNSSFLPSHSCCETISTRLSSFAWRNPKWQLQPQRSLNYRPTCHFYSADSSWQLKGTTTEWGYERGSLSDDSAGRMESCDVMETRLLTDTSKQASLSASADHYSYPRCMSVNTNSYQNNSTSVAACLCVC